MHLAVRDGHDVVYVESLRARGAVQVLSRLGGRWPLHATGTGQVLLAYASPDIQEEVVASPLRRFTANTITDLEQLRRTLAEVRRTGVAIAENQLTAGIRPRRPGPRTRRRGHRRTGGHRAARGGEEPRTDPLVLAATARGISRALGAPSVSTVDPRSVRRTTQPDLPTPVTRARAAGAAPR